jgi:hypothetical protein
MGMASDKSRQRSLCGSAIGVHHQNHPLGPMQAHRGADSFEDKFAIAFALGRSQELGASGNLDGVGVGHPRLVQGYLN